MARANSIAGLVCLVIAGAFGVQSWWSMADARPTAWGQGTFPFLASLGLAACGVALVWEGLSKRDAGKFTFSVRGVGLSVVASAVYVVLMEVLGFAIATGFTLAALFWVLGLARVQAAVIALAFAVLLHAIFKIWLYMPLPSGILGI